MEKRKKKKTVSGEKQSDSKTINLYPIEFLGKADNKGVHEITLYADNEMYLKELRICVSAHDWYLLKEQPCFLELIEFVHSLQTPESKVNLACQQD